MPGLSPITRGILADNAGRDPPRLELKLRGMAEDPFAFFRGTNPLFLHFLPRSHGLFRAPKVLVCGDLHVENFGAYKGDNRLVYFDLNDFDEACVAPFTIDIVRFVAGIKVASTGLSLSGAQCRTLVQNFMSAYSAAILDGKPRWLERTLAEGLFKQLLRRAIRRTRPELLDRLSKRKGATRRLKIDGRRTLPLHGGEAVRLRRFLANYSRKLPHGSFYHLIAAARRIAGNGSLGLPRFLLLVEGRGSPDQNFALDLKYAAPSAVAAWLEEPQPAWPTEAARVVTIQRIMQAIAPAQLHAVRFERGPFVLKELQPSIDRLDTAGWPGKPRRILEATDGMAHVTAWAHLRGCGHFGAVPAEVLQSYVRRTAWRRSLDSLASSAAARTLRAWESFRKDFAKMGAAELAMGAAELARHTPAPGE
jgi:uncharacterized protein (DUF2252 family)